MDTFDPSKQSFDITTANGAVISIGISLLDRNYHEMLGISINYGSQIGASIIMLIVVLTLNPKAKLHKMCTILHITSLIANIFRMVLLSIYFPSKWTEFYAMFSGDYSRITDTDMRNSVAGTISSYIVVVLVQASLIVQAWPMVKPWPLRAKWMVCILSLAVCLTTIGFRMAFCIFQVRATLAMQSASEPQWVAGYSIILDALSICCFCALFNVQLVAHLVRYGKFLPSKNGIKPIEALIMANGLLMIIPAIFACLEWSTFANFEAASLTYTSVVLILPLGTLVAHRLTDRSAQHLPNESHQPHRSGHWIHAWLDRPGDGHLSTVNSDPTSHSVTPLRKTRVDNTLEDNGLGYVEAEGKIFNHDLETGNLSAMGSGSRAG